MSTVAEAMKRHRKTGRGRRAWWIAVGLGVVVLATGLASPRANQPPPDHAATRWDGTRHGGGLPAAAAEIREHAWWLPIIGVSTGQADGLAEALERRREVFDDLESRRASVSARVAAALGAPTLDPSEIAAARAATHQIATQTIDAWLDLTTEVANQLTPAQRAALLRHWEAR